MSSTLRFSPSTFLGMPPLAALFGKQPPVRRAIARPVERIEPAIAKAKVAPAAPAEIGGLDMAKLLDAAKVAPKLALLEWDGDRTLAPRATVATVAAGAAGAVAEVPVLVDADPHSFEPRRRKIRDRYISARFPGVARGSNELQDPAAVIKSARLLFEEEQAELALELLELAVEETPHESQLWLARLEILFLLRDRDGFVATARAFQDAHRFHEAWPEVERLGRAIAPDEPLFGATAGPRDHEHYGPWPHLPNWIQAPWDLTAEVVAADFHRAVTRMTARLATAPN
jgi:hypothetical protein